MCHRDRPPALPGPPLPAGLTLFDAHCHPTDTMATVACIPSMRARTLTIMATRSQDQDLVADVARQLGGPDRALMSEDGSASASASTSVVPSFGWHPWFSHQLLDDTERPSGDMTPEEADKAKDDHYAAVLIPAPSADFVASLPPPTPLSAFLSATTTRLKSHPLALIGEVGLDKAFRLPQPWHPDSDRDASLTPGGREGRLLSPYRVRMPHQAAVLRAQLRLAGRLRRAVSVHGVQAHGMLYETLAGCWKGFEREVVSKRQQRRVAPGAEDFSDSESDEDDRERPFPPRICLHSYSGGPDMLKQYFHPAVPAKVFVSFSSAINMGTDNGRSKLKGVLATVPDDCVLIESDLHTAGEDMDAALEEMYRSVCEIKGWGLEDGIRRIARNYKEFIFG